MNFNLDFLAKIPRDKLGHFLAGCGVFFIFAAVSGQVWKGVFFTFLAAVTKESLDWLSNYLRAKKGLPPNHDVDFLDVVATTLGAFFSIFLTFYLQGVK